MLDKSGGNARKLFKAMDKDGGGRARTACIILLPKPQ